MTCNLTASRCWAQIRRRKCDFEELHCDTRPSIESYCDVARSIQLARGIADSDVRFFVAADVPETYPQVCAAPVASPS